MTNDNKPKRPVHAEVVKRSELEAACAAQIAQWLRGHALARASQPVVAETTAAVINATSVQTMLVIASAIDQGEWRPDWKPPVPQS